MVQAVLGTNLCWSSKLADLDAIFKQRTVTLHELRMQNAEVLCFVHLDLCPGEAASSFETAVVFFLSTFNLHCTPQALLMVFPRPRQVQVKFKLGSSWKTYTCVWSYWVVLFFNAHCYVINNIRTLIIIGWGFPVSITCAVKKPWSGQLTFNFIRMLLTENAEKKESDNHWFLALFSVQILSPEASRKQHFFYLTNYSIGEKVGFKCIVCCRPLPQRNAGCFWQTL